MAHFARITSPFRTPHLPLRLEPLEDRTTPATFTVTNLNDAGAGSLRDAVDRANVTTGADTIVFDSAVRGGTVKLTTFANPPTGNFAGPTALVVFDDIIIQGTGETITRGGTTPFRLFQVTGTGSLSLNNLTLSNGHALGGQGDAGGGGAAGLGGAIYNQGTVNINRSTLVGNLAEGAAGLDTIGTVTGRGGGGLGGGLAGVNGGGPNGGVAGGTPPGFGGGGAGGNFGAGNAPQNGGFGGGGGGGFAGFGGGNGGFGGGGGDLFAGDSGFGGFGAGHGGPAGTVNGSGGGGAGMGGAIFNQGGTVGIFNTTITGNTAVGGSGRGPGEQGGGFGGGVFNLNGDVVLLNSTIARNTVAAGLGGDDKGADGGALYSLSLNVGAATKTQTATVTATNSIFDSTVGLGSTVAGSDVVNNQVNGTATLDAPGPNIASAAVVNTGGALTGSPFTVVNPNLGPLSDNGGPTRTLAPFPGSPAIDAGNTSSAAASLTDQRGPGFTRVANGTVDLGAVEVQVPVVVNPAVLPDAAVGVPYSQTLTVSGPPGPFTFKVTAGALPHGILLDTLTGELSGTPTSTQAGVFTFTVTATDAFNETGSRAYTLNVNSFAPQPAATGGPTDGTARVLAPAGGKFSTGGALNFFPGLAVNLRTATADVTGDGIPDFVGGTGPGAPTQVAVIDGKSGATLVSFSPFEAAFTGGVYVAALDLDGDGKAEVVVSPDQGGGPVAAVFAGAKLAAGTGGDAAQVVRFLGIDDPAFRGGARVALGDMTGDGKAELIVAAGFLGGPRVTVWDGASVLAGSPTQRLNFFAFEATLRNGAFVAAGDLTGEPGGFDGVADIAFGGGPGGAPRGRVFDGKALLAAGPFGSLDEVGTAQQANFFAGDPSLRGGVRLALRDVNADGNADLVTGSGEGEPSRVRVFLAGSGATPFASQSPSADQDLDPFAGAVLPGGVFVG